MTEPHSRPGWDDYFLDLAGFVAARADCRRRQHGALIVKDNRVIATGYNGAPAGQPGCLSGACPRGLLSYDELASMTSYDEGPGRCISVHAEMNALLYSDYDRRQGGVIYITGEPCPLCRRLISGSGLSRVVWPEGGYLL